MLLGRSCCELQTHNLWVKTTVPDVKIDFLTIGLGLKTHKSQKVLLFLNINFFVVGSAKSEVLKVRASHEPILKTAILYYMENELKNALELVSA
jgi:hypothetical protein